MDLSKSQEKTEKEILNKTCPVCNKIFSSKGLVNRHLKEVHEGYEFNNRSVYGKNQFIYKCLEGCDISFRANQGLREHLNRNHGFNIQEKTKKFSFIGDFHKWLFKLQEDGVHFIKTRGYSRKTKTSQTTYYACHRTGIQKIKTGERKRKAKQHGSCKINAGCTCYVKLEEQGLSCTVTYCTFHYGHKIELEHLPLTSTAKCDIVNQLQNGAKIVKINLDNAHGNYIECHNLQRSKILTSADLKKLQYITRKQMGICPPVKRKNINVLQPTESSDIDENDEVVTVTTIDTADLEASPMEQNTLLGEPLSEVENVLHEGLEEEIHEEVEINQKLDTDLAIEEETKETITYEIEDDIDNNDDTNEYFEESTEDTYGQYVAGILEQMNSTERESAKNRIDTILKIYLTKSIRSYKK